MVKFRSTTAVVAGLTLGCALPAAPAGAASPRHDHVERSVIRKVNAIRSAYGVPRLRRSPALGRAADLKSREILYVNQLSHNSIDGSPMTARLRRFLRASHFGETIGWTPHGRAGGQAARMVRAWMSSPSHRATLLSPAFRRVGVARRSGTVGGRHAIAFTVDLASRR
jgi:uncharacterized protein YkwD